MVFDTKAWLEAEEAQQAKMTLTKEDVFGKVDHATMKRIDRGMVASYGGPEPSNCKIFGDEMPYKAVTVVCTPEQKEEVVYWLAYVHGGPYAGSARQPDGTIAIRSNYQAW